MRSAALLAVVASVLTIGTTSAAQAWQPPPATPEARLAIFLPIARAAWPGSPCAGRETIHLHAALDQALDYSVYGYDGYHPTADSVPADCLVEITDDAYPGDPTMWCSMLTHELGHLAGFDHNDDPTSIMYGGMLVPWPACAAALQPPRGMAGARYIVRQMLPNGASWRVSCTSLRRSHPRCRAERSGRRPRRFAMMIVKGDVVAAEPV